MPNYTVPYPFWLPLRSGGLSSTQLAVGSVTTLAVTQNILYACPLFVAQQVTLSAIGIEVTTFATGNVRLGIYYDSAGAPVTLLQDSGAVSTGTSNGFKSVVTTQVLTSGWWWLAAVFDATPTVRAITTANSLHMLGATSGTDTAIHTGVSVAFSYAALPNPFTGGSTLHTGNFPRIMVQV